MEWLALGTDNVYIPVSELDLGQMIAYVLQSNIYREAMITQNYMDLSQKVKSIGRQLK